MYAQVYHHKTVRAAEWMLIKVFERYRALAASGAEPPGLAPAAMLARGAELGVDGYLRLHDVSVTHALDAWGGRGDGAPADDPLLRDLAARLVDRRLFKTFDLGDDPTVAERLAEPAHAIAAKRFGADASTYVTVDTTRQIGYVARAEEELHVVEHPRHGTVTLGRLLEDMPLGQPTSTVRLLCAPELVDELRPVVEATLGRPTGKGRRG
jgi:hypothetical protein